MSPRARKTGHSAAETKIRTTVLTPLEEKVVRMRHGFSVPLRMSLEQVGQDNPQVSAQLRGIEERAIKAVSARMSPAKRKIVGALRHKER